MPDGRITRRSLIAVPFLGLTGCFGSSTAVVTKDPPRVFFVKPANRANVKSPFEVVFGVQGFGVRPAGDSTLNTGHHHLIIDSPAIAAGKSIPFDKNHIHLGSGPIAPVGTWVDWLSPGPHTLTAQFADGAHVAYGGLLTATITVVVG